MSILETDIPNKIKELKDRDQEFLKKHRSLNQYELKKIFHSINKENCKIMREIIKQCGLITISKFGEETSHSAWLLVQHFPKTSVRFMEKYLLMMKEKPDEIRLREIAYLEDRINSYLGKPTRFGTQGFKRKGSKIWKFRPIQDIQNIDTYRQEYDLEPLIEYAKSIEDYQKVKVILPNGYKSPINSEA